MAKTLKGRTQNPAYTAAVLKAKNPVLLKGRAKPSMNLILHGTKSGTEKQPGMPFLMPNGAVTAG